MSICYRMDGPLAVRAHGQTAAPEHTVKSTYAKKTRLSRSIWSCGASYGASCSGPLQTLVLETFPTCEGTRKGIYWETKQTNQHGFVVFKIKALMASEKKLLTIYNMCKLCIIFLKKVIKSC